MTYCAVTHANSNAPQLISQFVAGDLIRAGKAFSVNHVVSEGDSFTVFRVDKADATLCKNSIKRHTGWLNGEGR